MMSDSNSVEDKSTYHWSGRLWVFGAAFAVALVAVATVAVTLAQDDGAINDPDAGLTVEEKIEKHKRLSAESVELQARSVLAFVASGESPSGLQRVELMGQPVAAKLTLEELQRSATVIVHGRVLEQRVEVHPDFPARGIVISTFEAEGYFNGGAGVDILEIEQHGTPTRLLDGEFALGIHAEDPVLRTDREIVIFAAAGSNPNRWAPLPYSIIELDDDRELVPVGDNEHLAPLLGESFDEFIALMGGTYDAR